MRNKIGSFLVLLGIAANLFSIYLHKNIDFLYHKPETNIASISWLLSVIFYLPGIFIFFHRAKAGQDQKEPLDRKEKIIVFALLIAAIFFRLYKIDFLAIDLDEAFWLDEARKILSGAVKSPFGYIGDQPSNMPAYSVSMLLILLKNNYLAVRFTGIIYSLMNMIFIFSFLKFAFNKRTALFSLLFLSFSVWDIHMSRIGWNNVNNIPFLISGLIFFLYRGIKLYSYRDIALAGLFLGISLNLLYVAAISLIGVVIYFVFLFFKNKRKVEIIKLFLLFSLSAFIVFSPTLVKIKNNTELSLGKHRNVFTENLAFSKKQGGVIFYLNEFKQAISDFGFNWENFNLFGLWRITLDPLTILLLIIGLLYSLKKAGSPISLILLLFFLVMFIPVVIANRFTSIWREYGFLPSIYAFAGLGADQLIRAAPARFSRIFLVSVLFLSLISFGLIYANYYKIHLIKEPDLYETTCSKTARYIRRAIPEKSLILLPEEMCDALIRAVLDDKYTFATYNSYADIEKSLKYARHVTVVQIAHARYNNDFAVNNHPIIFEGRMKQLTPSVRSFTVKEGKKIHSYFYIQ